MFTSGKGGVAYQAVGHQGAWIGQCRWRRTETLKVLEALKDFVMTHLQPHGSTLVLEPRRGAFEA